jgi:hypothetical protein
MSIWWLVLVGVVGVPLFFFIMAQVAVERRNKRLVVFNARQESYRSDSWVEVEIDGIGARRGDWVISRAIGPDVEIATREALILAHILHSYRVGEIRADQRKITDEAGDQKPLVSLDLFVEALRGLDWRRDPGVLEATHQEGFDPDDPAYEACFEVFANLRRRDPRVRHPRQRDKEWLLERWSEWSEVVIPFELKTTVGALVSSLESMDLAFYIDEFQVWDRDTRESKRDTFSILFDEINRAASR